MKYFIFPILILAFTNVSADVYHHYKAPDISIEGDGTALAIATAQQSFDWSTQRWQGAIGVGSYNDSSAMSFGIGKKFCNQCPLFNSSFGGSDGKYGAGFGVNFRW